MGKRMKPSWDKLMEKYKGSKTALVADVDCTASGKPLCDTNGVRGYPTIKWGNPSSLEDYKGGRDLKALEKFAEENLKPMCSPTNLDLCDDEKKKQIEELLALSGDELKKKIETLESEMKGVSDNFEKEVKQLQATYEKLTKEKEEKLDNIKNSGLGLMKSVLAVKDTKEEL